MLDITLFLKHKIRVSKRRNKFQMAWLDKKEKKNQKSI